ncbi:MAG: endolytic transglycosylase MltG, partial [Gemmatimonadetes bacterium]|nr:endolytic transglycosylase MltG [Gemmatimonadota bacterium]
MARRGRRWTRGARRWTAVGAVAAAAAGWWGWREVGGTAAPDTAPVRVTIPRGASVRTAATALAEAGVLDAPALFRWYVTWRGAAAALKPGTYALRRGEGYATVLDALRNGRALLATVAIPEGFDLRDITPLLVRALRVPEDSVRSAVTDSAWRARLDVPAPTLEGYLFPATYRFPEGTTAREAVEAMLARFEAAWRPEWEQALTDRGVSRHEVVTMASIVEKEARLGEERPVIAAVYWNRLQKGMRLQADPTVQYALPRHTARVLYRDLAVDSRYNTYQHDGLPPGPIASPGAASLAAALAPAAVPYLFFV